eukprot:scaffold82393_cov63-Phaeocystis_antarctica.AAC.6
MTNTPRHWEASFDIAATGICSDTRHRFALHSATRVQAADAPTRSALGNFATRPLGRSRRAVARTHVAPSGYGRDRPPGGAGLVCDSRQGSGSPEPERATPGIAGCQRPVGGGGRKRLQTDRIGGSSRGCGVARSTLSGQGLARGHQLGVEEKAPRGQDQQGSVPRADPHAQEGDDQGI